MAPPKNQLLFEPNASIVLVGCRGAGKRTLGFMGALHLRRRLVTEDQYFEKLTGLTRGDYLDRHGKDQFARQDLDVFKRMLEDNRTGCIIECGMSSFNDEAQAALRDYARTNPVVYVHREQQKIFELMDDAAAARQLLEADASHRKCSNLEYYNLYDNSRPDGPVSAAWNIPGRPQDSENHGMTASPGPLSLPAAQQDFARFLDIITGRGATKAWLESPFSVAAIPPEFRSYSYALRLRLSYLMAMDLEWADFEARGDCVELIIDTWPPDICNEIARQVALIRRHLGVPIIYHVEEDPRGERRRPPEEKNPKDKELLELGLRLGVEYISVDLQRDESLVHHVLQHRGRSKAIGNYWYMGLGALPWQDPQQIENYERARALGCDIVRMVRFCTNDSPAECLDDFKKRLNEAIPDPKPPLVAYDFSVLGVRTPLQTRILGPVKHPDMDNGREHLATVSTAYHSLELQFRQFLLDPLKFYVLGSNVSYSLSPIMHAAAYDFCGMPHTFQAIGCSTLDRLQDLCLSDSFGGASLTAPFKVAIMPHLKVKSHHATAIGAVNVLLPLRGRTSAILDHANSRNKAGPAQDFFGDNTDWSSILTCLRRAISPRNYVQPSRTTGLVIGAGGMARAAIYALYQLGCRNIFIYNRTIANAEAVAKHFNDYWAGAQTSATTASTANGSSPTATNGVPAREICRVLRSPDDPWPAGFQQPTMIVSCVPATSVDGNNPPAEFEMPLGWLQSPTGGVVVELAYEPLVTPLVAQMRGIIQMDLPAWTVVDGLEVVTEMAIEAFELMTGRMAPRTLMKQVCRKAFERQQERRGLSNGAESEGGTSTGWF
ncbi:hypothetical protein VTJ49DRAFT_320 [Mycothermus thermophilus]|uniref:Quinate repressor protein n=1 Tax=Humicola insolens TaxID=85995 RepID=A0ABR3VH11_HUMIN